ncbi:MAG: hypothetical protein Ct9H300mP4_07580 [Gammaproteobacteria bacterium]|nr:MAG: hypothetical protein Ct9H300mP4_07580 [Gammaproteobacteria bacterium]
MRGIHKNCSRTLKSGLLLAIAFAPFFLQATTLIHAGKLIDGKSDQAQTKMTIVIKDNLLQM